MITLVYPLASDWSVSGDRWPLIGRSSHGQPLASEEGGLGGFPAKEVLQQIHAVDGSAGSEDHCPVVHTSIQTHHTLLVKPDKANLL